MSVPTFSQANQIGSNHAQLNKYEIGLNTPPLHSQRLIQRFQTIEEFDADKRETIINGAGRHDRQT
ncbi:hypothetical protein [Photobacterium sp. 2_MG-2023]|uniref:hypothetical protein n=1 Tax=Photobacterium sp. 2_MG-2023 TaxID=3062663 RepID=UPI0026E290A5|nr:hypothetical protein [Photobacterium sp. 2_MG-2023]